MYKIVVLYPKLEENFLETYIKEHVPLVKKIPNVKKIVINKAIGSPAGEPQFFVLAELHFETEKDMREALNSNEMREAARHAMKISKGKMQAIFFEEIKVE
ncbi:MAG: EthD family reductase [Thermoproteota archaeon]|jgi:uncharacterized protein (TIGR02118 family)|nr:EthD family reductase [Thermoproteota archaeon]